MSQIKKLLDRIIAEANEIADESPDVELTSQQIMDHMFGSTPEREPDLFDQLDMDEGESDCGHMPGWASRPANPDVIEVMAQLATRDGRVSGNATIFDITYDLAKGESLFSVITDAGNILCLTVDGLQEIYQAPLYIASEFPNNEFGQVDQLITEWYVS